MNELILVSIYDKISQTHTPPMAFVNKMTAGRYYLQLVNNNLNSEHYCMKYLGSFDSKECNFVVSVPVVVIDGINVIDLTFKPEVL